jgi:hypothetical protein
MDIGRIPPKIETLNIDNTPNTISTISSEVDKKEISSSISTTISTSTSTSTDHAYRICKNCSYFEKLIERTLVLSRTNDSSSISKNLDKYKFMIYDKSLPHTRDYICKNKSCESHKNNIKKDAVWFRPNQKNYNTIMACCTCMTLWNIS